jgi:hypothetical protein
MPTRADPAVSIVLPTFNRADVIGRAIDSVRRQTFEEWELLIVDDGSTDGTAALLEGLDPRLVVIRQENAGVYVARNTGLARARGRFITFLDSDDAWAPHYLELSAAFLAHHAEAAFVTTEFWEDWGQGPAVKHDLHEVREKYPRQAKAIGSTLFSLPPDEIDDYLRLYTWRAPVGEWGRAALERAGIETAWVYRGHIFAHMRFGYLNWLPTTMLTRAALDTVGPFATHTRSAADYGFLGRLARAFPANMIAVPGATKFDRSAGGQQLRQDHLASGGGSYQFARDLLAHFDQLYPLRDDPETAVLRRHLCLKTGRAAMAVGRREEARALLREAAAPARFLWRAYPGLAWAQVAPSDRVLATGLRAAARAGELASGVLRGEINLARVARRLRRTLFDTDARPAAPPASPG